MYVLQKGGPFFPLSFNCMAPYHTDALGVLQEPFLRATVVHYAAEGQRYMATTDVAEYLLHCEASGLLIRPGLLLCPFMSSARRYAFLAGRKLGRGPHVKVLVCMGHLCCRTSSFNERGSVRRLSAYTLKCRHVDRNFMHAAAAGGRVREVSALPGPRHTQAADCGC